MMRMGLRVRRGAAKRATRFILRGLGPARTEVGGGKSGVEQALAHGLGGGGDAAHRIGGVDLDELLEDVVGELPGGGIERLLRGQIRAEGREGERGGQKRGGKRRSTRDVHGVLLWWLRVGREFLPLQALYSHGAYAGGNGSIRGSGDGSSRRPWCGCAGFRSCMETSRR